MELREVPDPESARSFRDRLKAWQERDSADPDVERSENEGMAPEPQPVNDEDLEALEDDFNAFEAGLDDEEDAS